MYPSSEKKETSFAMSFRLPSAADRTEERRRDTPRIRVASLRSFSDLRRHRRVGPPNELIQSRLRGGKQACLDVFDGLVCTHRRGRHEVGAANVDGGCGRNHSQRNRDEA